MMPPPKVNLDDQPYHDWSAAWLRLSGLGIALYLGLLSLLHLPCVGGGCDAVLHSRWSVLLGLPVGFYGVIAWSVALLAPPGARRWAHHALAAGSLGFISLQFFVIGHFCPWCLAHAVICGLAWPFREVSSPRWTLLGGVALAGVLLAVQVGMSRAPGPIAKPTELMNSAFTWLSPQPESVAPVLVVSLTCPHCLDLLAELPAVIPAGKIPPRIVFLVSSENRELTETFVAVVLDHPSPADAFRPVLALLLSQRDLILNQPKAAAQWLAFTTRVEMENTRVAAEKQLARQQTALGQARLAVSPAVVDVSGHVRVVSRVTDIW